MNQGLQAPAVVAHPMAPAGEAREFLTFTVGQEEYAIDILAVREIRGYERVTSIAHAPAFIKGVIALRGASVPIVELRPKFELGAVRYDAFTVVIILNLTGRSVGIVADAVSDVVALTKAEIQPAPALSNAVSTRCIAGLAATGDRMLIVMDIEKLTASVEMALTDERAVPA